MVVIVKAENHGLFEADLVQGFHRFETHAAVEGQLSLGLAAPVDQHILSTGGLARG